MDYCYAVRVTSNATQNYNGTLSKPITDPDEERCTVGSK